LKGMRGRAGIDLGALEQILVQFSQLVVEQRRIKEMDVNPLLASPDRLLALDARIVLFGAELGDEDLPSAAIRPYPAQYISHWRATDGAEIVFRPIRPEDETLLVKFHESLSEQSVYLRYFHMENLSSRVAHERLIRKCFIDYDREIALVAEFTDARRGEHELRAVGRLSRSQEGREAEVSVLVTDKFQHAGLGSELLGRLLSVARAEKMGRIVAHILPENSAMRALAARYGFKIEKSADPGIVTAVLNL
jgi:acetyltransferase